EIERNEMVLSLPDQVRKENQDRQRDSIPQPLACHIFAGTREQHSCDDTQGEEAHRVFRHHPQADCTADSQPPAWIFACEQPHDKVSGEYPTKMIERDILHQGARSQAKRNRSSCRNQLSTSVSTKFLRDQAREKNSSRLRESCE